MPFKYRLDQSSKKFICPGCQKKRFVRYLDIEIGQYTDDQYGRCDREVNCGYHKMPEGRLKSVTITPEPVKARFYVSKDTVRKTLSCYSQNNLFLFISKLFGERETLNLFRLYQVGISKHWDGASLFWQINSQGQPGQGKIMLFDKETGKRVKDPFPHISSVHKLMNKQDQKPKHCFFGEHLIRHFSGKPIAIVESEKTALIMAAIQSDYIWIASGGLSNLNMYRMQSFKDRLLVFYPDLGAFEKWYQKAQELNNLCFKIKVSDLLEVKGTSHDKNEGFDIADYFIKNRLKTKLPNEDLEMMLANNPVLQKLIDRFQLA